MLRSFSHLVFLFTFRLGLYKHLPKLFNFINRRCRYVIRLFQKHLTSCYWVFLQQFTGNLFNSPLEPTNPHTSSSKFWHLFRDSKNDIFLREYIKALCRYLQPVTWHRLHIIPTWIVFQYAIIQDIMTEEELDIQNPIHNRLRGFLLTSATRLPLRPTDLPIRWVKAALYLGLKCMECEVDLSCLSENEAMYLNCDVWNRTIIYEEIYLN